MAKGSIFSAEQRRQHYAAHRARGERQIHIWIDEALEQKLAAKIGKPVTPLRLAKFLETLI